MAIITEVDIRFMLGRLGYDADDFHWAGDGPAGNTMAVVIWRNPQTVKPSEAAVLAEHDAWAAEEAAKAALEIQSDNELDAANLGTVEQALLDIANAKSTIALGQSQIANDLAVMTGSPTNAQVVQVIIRLLNRENAILNGIDATLTRQQRIIKALSRPREKVRML